MNVHEVLQVIDSPLLLVNPQGQEVHSQVRNIATLDYTQRDFYLAFVRDGHQGRRGRICICWSEGECQVLAQL